MQITRRVEIDAGHRLQRHGGKCATLHGHRYAFEVTLDGEVDEVGVVLDFADLKQMIEEIVMEWDHAVVLEETDPLVPVLREAGQRVAILGVPPSAENFAEALGYELIRRSLEKVSHPLPVVHVRCYETPTCWADWRRK